MSKEVYKIVSTGTNPSQLHEDSNALIVGLINAIMQVEANTGIIISYNLEIEYIEDTQIDRISFTTLE